MTQKKIAFSEEVVNTLFSYLADLPFKHNPGVIMDLLRKEGAVVQVNAQAEDTNQ